MNEPLTLWRLLCFWWDAYAIAICIALAFGVVFFVTVLAGLEIESRRKMRSMFLTPKEAAKSDAENKRRLAAYKNELRWKI
jgi:hypothetical protein